MSIIRLIRLLGFIVFMFPCRVYQFCNSKIRDSYHFDFLLTAKVCVLEDGKVMANSFNIKCHEKLWLQLENCIFIFGNL